MSRIFLYWISVSIVSVPFIFFSTRYAKVFNLRKWEAFTATILFSILSLTFPVYLQKGKLLLWGILTCGVFTLLLGMIGVKIRALTQKEWAPELSMGLGEAEMAVSNEVADEGIEVEEVIKEAEVVKKAEVACMLEDNEQDKEQDKGQDKRELPSEEEKSSEEISSIEETLSIEETSSMEELLERGFNAKERKDYVLAAESFLQAIAKNPPPDILYYLITDTYWLWKIGHSVHEAVDKVKPYFEHFLQVAPPEWRIQFMVWLENEGLMEPYRKEFRAIQ